MDKALDRMLQELGTQRGKEALGRGLYKGRCAELTRRPRLCSNGNEARQSSRYGQDLPVIVIRI
jgi:hypothetical protein